MLTKRKSKKLISHSKKLDITGIIISIGLNTEIKTRTWFYIYNKDFKAARIYVKSYL